MPLLALPRAPSSTHFKQNALERPSALRVSCAFSSLMIQLVLMSVSSEWERIPPGPQGVRKGPQRNTDSAGRTKPVASESQAHVHAPWRQRQFPRCAVFPSPSQHVNEAMCGLVHLPATLNESGCSLLNEERC